MALREFDHRVRAITDDDWLRPTPCTEWSVHDLLNHLVAEQLWVPSLLSGATMDEVGDRFDGDQLGPNPHAAWRAAAGTARGAWLEPDVLERTVHLSFGDAPASDYGWQMTLDLAVHGWDLAVAIGVNDEIADELAGVLLAEFEPQIRGWQGAGIFAPPLDPPQGASNQTRLLALLGRNRNWRSE